MMGKYNAQVTYPSIFELSLVYWNLRQYSPDNKPAMTYRILNVFNEEFVYRTL
jgi:hypothetical protein